MKLLQAGLVESVMPWFFVSPNYLYSTYTTTKGNKTVKIPTRFSTPTNLSNKSMLIRTQYFLRNINSNLKMMCRINRLSFYNPKIVGSNVVFIKTHLLIFSL